MSFEYLIDPGSEVQGTKVRAVCDVISANSDGKSAKIQDPGVGHTVPWARTRDLTTWQQGVSPVLKVVNCILINTNILTP